MDNHPAKINPAVVSSSFTHQIQARLRETPFYRENAVYASFADIICHDPDMDLLHPWGIGEVIEQIEYLYHFFSEGEEEAVSIEVKPYSGAYMPHRRSAVHIMMNLIDRPYIVSSFLEYLRARGIKILTITHPLMVSARDSNGGLTSVSEGDSMTDRRRSFTWCVADVPRAFPELETELRDMMDLLNILHSEAAVIKAMMFDLSVPDADDEKEEVRHAEGRQLFKWMLKGNVFLLGGAALSEERLRSPDKWEDFTVLHGIMRLAAETADNELLVLIQQGLHQFSMVDLRFNLLEIPRISSVFRRVNIILAMHKGKDKDGRPTVYIFPLVFTPASLHVSPTEIPIARLKIYGVFERCGIVRESHNYRQAVEYFTHFPRPEIFRMERDEMGFLLLNTQKNTWKFRDAQVFFYRQPSRNYLRISIVVPQAKYFPDSLRQTEEVLKEKLAVPYNYTYRFEFSDNVHIHYIYWSNNPLNGVFSQEEITDAVKNIFHTWEDRLIALADLPRFSEFKSAVLPGGDYYRCFSEEYQIKNTPEQGLVDLSYSLKAYRQKTPVIRYELNNKTHSTVSVYTEKRIELRHVIGILEKCSLFVDSYNEYKQENAYIFRYQVSHTEITDADSYAERVSDLLHRLIADDAESDRIYSLIVVPGMNYEAISVLKAYRNYFVQVIPVYRLMSIDNALLENPKAAQLLFSYFSLKFKPAGVLRYNSHEHLQQIREELMQEIAGVSSLSTDYILRAMMSLIDATVRTNFYQSVRDALAFKIECALSTYIPGPKLPVEIYVDGEIMQGVHMRGGRVARGGIRFSDRRDDFRTEVLGLARAQVLKNAVIVPTGSKGGFVVRKKWDTRAEMAKDSEIHYRRYIRALLSVTDNIIEGKVVPPAQTVCYDGDDPYLVVAADKGTAAFSDIANEISLENKFWLGDAFASGGSIGYGHKSLGITAKGAWECVKLHFRDLGKSMDEPFTVVGIGDMSGDVFGNGMLLSDKIRLVGAFNHLHIFVDPNPDPTVSYAERVRMFNLPVSGYRDYDAQKISQGGGVFERSAKSIKLTSEMIKLLKTDKITMSGIELIRALLTLKVDLLWNGGIGTYVKSSAESSHDVGDSQNDDVRVNGAEVQADIIAEGGNLGVTPKGRIEYELSGGRINADSIDNSAGVNLSDHEVNIKILLNGMKEAGMVGSNEERTRMLAEMAEDVVELCLKDSADNGRMISMEQRRSMDNMGFFITEIEHIERVEGLNRKEENIPSNEELNLLYQKKLPVPRAVMAVLGGHTKNYVSKRILNSSIPDQPVMYSYYADYFPKRLRADSLSRIPHRLKREIIAMRVTNYFVNNYGVTFIAELANMTRRRSYEIVTGFLIADSLFDGRRLTDMINMLREEYDGQRAELTMQKERLLKRETTWLLTNHAPAEIGFDLVERYQRSVSEILRTEAFYKDKADRPVFNGELSDEADKYKLLPVLQPRNYLELAYLKTHFSINLETAEKLSALTDQLFSFSETEKRLTDFKTSSGWEQNHIGLLIIRLNRIKQQIYSRFAGSQMDLAQLMTRIKEFESAHSEGLRKFSVTRIRFLTEQNYIISAAESLLYEAETLFLT